MGARRGPDYSGGRFKPEVSMKIREILQQKGESYVSETHGLLIEAL
jgi:hypothetical protein